tara:strand:- start:660 stop:1709 length:1050 start_codon:yes stop_codon:yes gene_type:complete
MRTAERDFKTWIAENHFRFVSLSEAAQNIVTNLLQEEGIEFLTITQRTKDIDSCLEKSKRKNYKSPKTQTTDISGIRIIVFLECDIVRISKIIEDAFFIDTENSLNQDDLLSSSEMGYRSVHYVCELGSARSQLPEFRNLGGLKFEIQLRTVLQHAWAELSHDRNYKFSGVLPKHLERQLFLLSALLETADKGFDELSKNIDEYISEIQQSYIEKDLNIEINSLSVRNFIKNWCSENRISLFDSDDKNINDIVIEELENFGIKNIQDLQDLIPNNYRPVSGNSEGYLGLVRNWMIIENIKKYVEKNSPAWWLPSNELPYFEELMPSDDFKYLTDNVQIDHDFDEIDLDD